MSKTKQILALLASIKERYGDGFQYNPAGVMEDLKAYQEESTSITIKIISVLGAILGTSFLMTFFVVIKFFQQSIPLIILGFLFNIGSIIISRFTRQLIFQTSSLAFLIYGGIMIGIGLNALHFSAADICIVLFILGLASFIFSGSRMQEWFGLLTALISLTYNIELNKLSWLFHVYHFFLLVSGYLLFVQEAKWMRHSFFSKKLGSMQHAFVLIFLFISATISTKYLQTDDVPYKWIAAIAPMIGILWILDGVIILLGFTEKKNRYIIEIISLLVLLPTAIFPAISSSIFLVLLCFKVNHRNGWVTGLIALFVFIVKFYYDLAFNLLVKSELLLLSGVLFAVVYFLFQKKMQHEKV